MKLSAIFLGSYWVCVVRSVQHVYVTYVKTTKKDEHGKNMMHWMWSFFLILFKIQVAGGFHCSTYSVWSIDISGATPRRLWPHGSCGLWSTPYPTLSFLFGCLCEVYDSCLLQLAFNHIWLTDFSYARCANPSATHHHNQSSNTNKNAFSSNNKQKTRPIEDAGRRVSACLRCHCPALIATLLHLVTARDFPISPLDFPHFRIYIPVFCVFLLSAILRQFCCKPSGGKRMSVCMAARKLEWVLLQKKHNNDKDGDLIAISMTNVSIVLQWPHHCN